MKNLSMKRKKSIASICNLFFPKKLITDFEISPGLIQFYIYHNENTCNIFDDMLFEFHENLDFYGLAENKWRAFTCRPIYPDSTMIHEYRYCVLTCIDLLKNMNSIDDISLDE